MLCTSAFAFEELEGTQANRYTLERVDDNFIRLDKNTGQISICKFSHETLVCRMALDDRNVLENEITILQNRIASLENNSNTAPNKVTPNDGTNIPTPPNNIPKKPKELSPEEKIIEKNLDKNFESALKYSNKIMRRFFDVMKELRLEFEDEEIEGHN